MYSKYDINGTDQDIRSMYAMQKDFMQAAMLWNLLILYGWITSDLLCILGAPTEIPSFLLTPSFLVGFPH
ncbi:MAG TPA: hypothetical protein PKD85_03830 [Saprospiraceae bacterium]|nr:hypothetical protein [Saprospiraceae bacterium]